MTTKIIPLLSGIARLESRLYLGSQLLRDVDVMAMAHGLEVRVPFVDHELVGTVWPELAFHASLVRHLAIHPFVEPDELDQRLANPSEIRGYRP